MWLLIFDGSSNKFIIVVLRMFYIEVISGTEIVN